MTNPPSFSTLSSTKSRAVLERNHVGRLAFWNGSRVDIRPLAYVAKGEWIFLRTAPGEKIAATAHRPYVAFEVDEVEGPFDWRSVVVHGSIHMLPEDGSPVEQRELKRAIAELRRMIPLAFTEHDPVPERDLVCGIHIHETSGRSASTPG